MIGKRCPTGSKVVRLTIDDDVTTTNGMDKARDAVRKGGKSTLLWAAIPCTGGSPWQHVNLAKCGPKTRAKIFNHRRTFLKIWKSSEVVAEECINLGGKIAIEWPTSCMYWKYRMVKRFVNKHCLTKTRFDGCMYGLVARRRGCEGTSMKKSWTVMTNSNQIPKSLNVICDRSHRHVHVMGQDTKPTEGYTDQIVDSIHKAWSAELSAQINPLA